MSILSKQPCKLRIVALLLLFVTSGYNILADGEHPRGLFGPEKILQIREKVQNEPYRSMFETIMNREKGLSDTGNNVYKQASLIKTRAFLFALTGADEWSQRTFEAFQKLASDSLFVNNDYSFGLTRAAILMSFSWAYDLCYEAWTPEQRDFAHQATFSLMQSVNANMGPSANYALESNWMGVRYGSTMFAAVVLKDAVAVQNGTDLFLSSYIWDIKERLRDHVDASHTPRGWFVESMGYHDYDAAFVWPGIMAFQNLTGIRTLPLEEYVPKTVNSLDQHITGTVSIPARSRLGVKPDLADDNVGAGFLKWPLALGMMPKDQQPYIRWMHNYLLDFKKPELVPEDVFYSIVFYDDNAKKISPLKGGYLNYVDTIQGVAFFRNTFKDSTDIVATFNASSQRKRGHAGPDNLTFRIAGLGNIWVVGGGRTQDPLGQTNLFPSGDHDYPRPWPEGEWIDHEFFKNGSGYAIASGSCLGVEEHKRFFAADYSPENGARAVFVISDVSDNGGIWRLHTPGFNQVKVLEDGAIIHAPNKSSMKISLPRIEKPDIKLENIRYGGATVRHNPGVMFHKKAFYDNHLVDIKCDQNLLVVITLAGPGETHPSVKFDRQTSRVMTTKKIIEVPFHGDQNNKND